MSETLIYRSRTPLALAEVVALEARLRAGFKGFKGFRRDSEQTIKWLDLEALPDLARLPDVELGHPMTRGRLPLDSPPFDTFREILARGRETLGPKSQLGVSVGFEEAGSRQTPDAYDSISIRLRAGKLFFEYSANGSRVSQDPVYARSFIERLITLADLPLAVSESGEHYFLAHTGGLSLGISQSRGARQESPSGFRCELSGVLPESCVVRMERCLAELATPRRFDYSWNAGPARAPLGKAPEDREIYEAVRDLSFPAERYEVFGDLYLNALAAIESVRPVLSPRDRLTTTLGVLKIGDNRLEVEIATESTGHWLDVDADSPIEPSELERIFGVPFEELYPGIG